MEYPTRVPDRIKYWFWRIYTPLHPFVRGLGASVGIRSSLFLDSAHANGRQDYLIGILHPKRSIKEFITFLVEQGFGNHFVAWKDNGEIVSLRKTIGFHYQYHIRVFNDGEVRCHYEYTPEYRPLQHLLEIGLENRAQEFSQMLAGWILPAKVSL